MDAAIDKVLCPLTGVDPGGGGGGGVMDTAIDWG